MILNYDLTFLAMVLSDGAGRAECRRCAIHPVKGCPCAEGDPALNTAADMSVILTYWQLRDGVADHGFWGGLKYRVASALLGRAYRKARQALPWFDRGARQQLDELSALERESCPTLDEPADAFARLLALAAGEIAEEKRRRVTEQMLYHLGRWIYLTDAADDLRSDMKTGSYNPLALRFAPEDGRLRPCPPRHSVRGTVCRGCGGAERHVPQAAETERYRKGGHGLCVIPIRCWACPVPLRMKK